jgi:hypothetical protein
MDYKAYVLDNYSYNLEPLHCPGWIDMIDYYSKDFVANYNLEITEWLEIETDKVKRI